MWSSRVQGGTILVSILLASGLEPFIGWIRGHVNLGRGATILVVYAAFFAAVLGLAFLVIPGALLQLNELTRNLPSLLSGAREWASSVQPNALGGSITAVIDTVEQTLRPGAPDGEGVLAAGLTVAEILISVGTALAIVFFWLTEHARLQRYTLAFLPPERRAGAREAWNEIEGRLGSWVRGQVILMGTMGLATKTAYTLLGLEGAVLLGLVAALAEAIPLVGPALGAIPALLVAATQSPELVVIVALVYVVIQAVEGNVLVPVVMRNTIVISPFLVIVSILVGAAIGGVVGAFLAVPFVAAWQVVLERLQDRDSAVAIDPTSTSSPDRESKAQTKASLPDSADTSRPGLSSTP